MLRMGKNRSWIKTQYRVPLRSCYLYWDKKPYEGSIEFCKEGIKVKWIKGELVHPEKPYIGLFVSCWNKDTAKVEKILDRIDEKLRIIDKGYGDFIKEWQQGLLKFLG